jgi:hypothetical protein
MQVIARYINAINKIAFKEYYIREKLAVLYIFDT